MTAAGAFVIGRFRLQRIDLRQRVDTDPPRHRCVAADLRDRIDDTLPHRSRSVAISFSASFRTTPEPSRLTMMTSPLIASLRGPSSDKSHSGTRCWSELIAPPARLCLLAPPRRRLELSKFADADPFGVCAAGVVLRTVMTTSYKASQFFICLFGFRIASIAFYTFQMLP